MKDLVIAVTGASGLVGSHLVDYLAAREYRVVAVVRSSTSAKEFLDRWRRLKVSLFEANVSDLPSLKQALDGVDVVVHAAGVVDPYGTRSVIFDVNVEGTGNVLAAAKAQAVKQFVYVSSLSVITGQHDQYGVGEEVPVRKCGEAYADSKVEAELLVMAESVTDQIVVTAVRPGFIYGPREHAWLPRLIDSIASGKAALIDGGTKQTNVIYVENLNRAIEATFLNPKAYGQVYNLTDGEVISKKQLFDAIADGLNLPRVKKVVPGFIARAFCQVVSEIAHYLPVEKQRALARYSRAAFRLAGVNQGFSIAKAERDLAYLNRVPFREGMAITLASFKSAREKTGGEKLLTSTKGESG
jgi:nucleoside-diphosphate-sugar epimerase